MILILSQCSEDDLCTTCERAAKICYSHEKGALSFVGCIRTTLAQVSVFEHGNLPMFILQVYTMDELMPGLQYSVPRHFLIHLGISPTRLEERQ
jgi:hypothetical protein